MASPLTNFHILYEPSGAYTKASKYYSKNSEILTVNAQDFDVISRSAIYNDVGAGFPDFQLIPIRGIPLKKIGDIKNIHLVLVKMRDIPEVLSALKFRYVVKYDEANGTKIKDFYFKDENGAFALKKNLTAEQKSILGLFFLSHGKLFNRNGLPDFSSTLLAETSNRPNLVQIDSKERSLAVLWPLHHSGVIVNRAEKAGGDVENLYLGINKGLLERVGDQFIFIQFQFSDSQTLSQYYIFE